MRSLQRRRSGSQMALSNLRSMAWVVGGLCPCCLAIFRTRVGWSNREPMQIILILMKQTKCDREEFKEAEIILQRMSQSEYLDSIILGLEELQLWVSANSMAAVLSRPQARSRTEDTPQKECSPIRAWSSFIWITLTADLLH